MFVHENGDLILANVSEDHSGHYHCQVNESGVITNGSSYVLSIHNPTESIDGKQ